MLLKFKDIEAIIEALAIGHIRPTSPKMIERLEVANVEANKALWKIREHLVLDDDYGLTVENRIKLKKHSLVDKSRKWDELDIMISKFYDEEQEDLDDGLISIGEIAARAFGYL